MSSKIFNALIEEKIDNFINTFQNTSRVVFFDEKTQKLIHSGEFGIYREKIVKDFLKFFIPQKFDIGNGFLISSNNEVSTQCDIIVYDKNITPLIQSNENQTFYPVETVVCVGEIKSILSKVDFIDAINKLARIKKIKSNIEFPNIHKSNRETFNPYEILYDSIFTFIICERLDFKLDKIEDELESMYENNIDACHRHNLILSIEDGLLLYNLKTDKHTMLFYAPIYKGKNTHKFLKYNENKKYHHFKTFAMSLFDGISQATILFPNMVHYLDGFEAINKLD